MRYKVEIVIDSPRDQLIEVFDNPENLGKWQPTFLGIEHVEGVERTKGAGASAARTEPAAGDAVSMWRVSRAACISASRRAVSKARLAADLADRASAKSASSISCRSMMVGCSESMGALLVRPMPWFFPKRESPGSLLKPGTPRDTLPSATLRTPPRLTAPRSGAMTVVLTVNCENVGS